MLMLLGGLKRGWGIVLPSIGGGGGGYSGGGGGQHVDLANQKAGGGGGSYNSGTNQVNSAGVNAGHGKVIITLVD